jgi:RNA polymerase sigma-70 factor, ECF subfamily
MAPRKSRGKLAENLTQELTSVERLGFAGRFFWGASVYFVKDSLVLERVVSELYAPLYRFALALAESETEAADLTQETFLILCRQHQQVREPDKVKSWLFTTLRRTFLRTRRRRLIHPEMELTSKNEPSTVDSTGPRSVDAEAILNALSELDEDYRRVLELFYLAELSYKEISAALEIPIGTVMSRISRGKERLREALKEAESNRL